MADEAKARALPKRRAERRLALRITHKQDIELWDELRQREDFSGAADSEILRQGLRGLADARRVADQLEGFEKRMGGSLQALHRRFDAMESSLQINMAFLEVLMRTYYFHTTPVPKEAAPQAVAEAKRRIDRFIEDVAGMLQKGGSMQELTLKLMDRGEGMDDGSGR